MTLRAVVSLLVVVGCVTLLDLALVLVNSRRLRRG